MVLNWTDLILSEKWYYWIMWRWMWISTAGRSLPCDTGTAPKPSFWHCRALAALCMTNTVSSQWMCVERMANFTIRWKCPLSLEICVRRKLIVERQMVNIFSEMSVYYYCIFDQCQCIPYVVFKHMCGHLSYHSARDFPICATILFTEVYSHFRSLA